MTFAPDAPDIAGPAEPAATPAAARRGLRSYVLRTGRLTSGQARALAELGPRSLVAYRAQPVDWDACFGRRAPRVLEIGFGMGEATAQLAHQQPERDFIGVEVHTPGVGSLLLRMRELGLDNVRIVQHDAVEVLRDMVTPGSLDAVHVYFPDPWHKKRHHKRRLIQPALVALVASRLRPGGLLHCATDWQDYAEHMLRVLQGEAALRNTAQDYAQRPSWRMPSRFEQRGLRLGHGVWDLLFERRACAGG
jgi:tRNA (guanine-N7-)-methyltransferase